ncbi:MAG: ABC transporter substrate-binding protein, partial [Terriglobales bacterium]
MLPASLAAQTPSTGPAGKLIYSQGESPAGNPLEAVLADTTVPATLMPCASCHGADGKGRAEGGITPSEITWSALMRARETDHALERRRPAYDLGTLRKVLREGVDPAGNELGITMPRYQISDGDLESLIAYLRQLGVKSDPGVTAASVRIATVVPATGPMAESGASVAELLRAYFAELNQQGGVYGRKIELDVIETRDTPAATADAVLEFVRAHEVFAVVSLLAPGAERQVADAMEASGIPAIDAFAPDADDRLLTKAKVFHVLSGLSAQARALVRFAQNRIEDRTEHGGTEPASSLVLLYPESKQRLAASVMEECEARSCRSFRPLSYTTFDAVKTVATLGERKPSGIVFLGQGAELQALLAAAERINWRPQIFQPGPLAGEGAFRIPAEASERVFFSFPTLPSDLAP